MEHVKLKTFGENVEEDADDYSELVSFKKEKSKKHDVERLIKISAMACACTFGVGSHFASHIIGPLKGILMEQLDLTNTQFSLLVASFTLCNTVIPIVSGLLVARFGTTTSSLVTTTIILIGMIIVTVASWTGEVVSMIIGFMVFGMGLAPLTIVQETIIVQFFQGNGLGFALAVGLIFGRLASFFATILAVPLSLVPPLTYRTPFFVAAFTSVNKIIEKKTVHWDDIFQLSDLFWWSLVVGLLLGMTISPFVHLSSMGFIYNIINTLVAGSAAILTTYLLFLLPPHLIHPFPPILLFAFAYGSIPLTTVSLVPLLTKHVSTGLGLLKSVDNIGATLSQTFAGLLLDQHVKGKKYEIDDDGIEYGHEDDDLVAVRMFAFLAFLLLLSNLIFWWADKKYKGGIMNSNDDGSKSHNNDEVLHDFDSYGKLRDEEDEYEEDEDDEGDEVTKRMIEVSSRRKMRETTSDDKITFGKTISLRKKIRTKIYIGLIALMLLICWVTFATVAFEKAGVHATDDDNNNHS
ncbi:169_t:CDS:2 [Entrophospora sp. SA101]|nr:169_t:CDS:2 [Entrophospora sp. SA101]